jgi:hypothetical protein
MGRSSTYSAEVRDGAVRMVLDQGEEYGARRSCAKPMRLAQGFREFRQAKLDPRGK